MTNYNLLQAIQDYGNSAYVQGEIVGSRIVTLKESREEEGFKRFIQFAKITNMLLQMAPQEVNKELLRKR